ncbi:MAG: 23S rRNA (adenine(2503)-C(2))-methyltransferase RlmN [Candidatus Marinimicrobia bacterium]|nr:23S rRNA (adenine(2503)-C(2))-methyltransferase RlmN [Candidatus Neomarinimicrobiota bacterium]
MNKIKQQILEFTLDELKTALAQKGEKNFRAHQIFIWLHKKNAQSFDEMSNISKSLRDKLNQEFDISVLEISTVMKSQMDTTSKYLFKLQDGQHIESVYMKQEDGRVTLCVSTMVGCPIGCPYCATGLMGFRRNLTTAEIVNQLTYINSLEEQPVTNIVFMGMGEPFLNYDNVIKAAQMFNSPSGAEISARKITLSTCGIVPGIHRFTREDHKFKLAVSLNGTNDEQRNIMIPVNRKYSLKMLMQSLQKYTERSGQRVTFEYILVKNFNDSNEDAMRLKTLLGSIPCKLNIIPYNENNHCAFLAPDEDTLNKFIKKLYKAPFAVTVRRSKGQDIAAACGQLYAETKIAT